jgi:hypothetical protein
MSAAESVSEKLDKLEITPFVILVDGREKSPWHFKSIPSKSDSNLIVQTKYAHLKTGDYTIEGMESVISIERKSKPDAYMSFGINRGRFEKELERLSEMRYAAVIFESDWTDLVRQPPHSDFNPRSMFGSIVAWSQRYGVQFWPMPGKRAAELMAYSILERFYRDIQDGKQVIG